MRDPVPFFGRWSIVIPPKLHRAFLTEPCRREGGQIKAYGAGILSSVGELEAFGDMDHRAWDRLEMSTRTYDITRYQDVLFIADSMDHLENEFSTLLADYDDDTPARLAA